MKLYRYERDTSDDGLKFHKIILNEFEVIKESEGGFWIEIHGRLKFTPKAGNCIFGGCNHKSPCREFACIDKEGALNQFISRNQRTVLISRAMLQSSRKYLETAKQTKI